MVRFDDLHLRDGTPIYLQIIQHLKAGIAAGTVQDGDELPSRRTLSALLGVNPNTVQKAYQLLEHDGYICSVPGKGSFLCDMGDEAAKKKREAEQALEHAIRSALENAVSPDEIRALVERILTGGEAT